MIPMEADDAVACSSSAESATENTSKYQDGVAGWEESFKAEQDHNYISASNTQQRSQQNACEDRGASIKV